MPTVSMGNTAPIHVPSGYGVGDQPQAAGPMTTGDGQVITKTITTKVVPGDWEDDRALQEVIKSWPFMSAAPPAWITGDDEIFVKAVAAAMSRRQRGEEGDEGYVAAHVVQVGRPEGWGDDYECRPASPEEAAQIGRMRLLSMNEHDRAAMVAAVQSLGADAPTAAPEPPADEATPEEEGAE